MSKKLLVVTLLALVSLALTACVVPPMPAPAATAAEEAQAAMNIAAENIGEKLVGTPEADKTAEGTTASAGSIAVTPEPGSVEDTVVQTMQGVAVTLPQGGCTMVVGTREVTVPEGTVDSETGKTCKGGSFDTFEISEFSNVLTQTWYARTIQPIGEWTRIREGYQEGQYFSWNFLTKVACNRAVLEREVSWDHPILLQIHPSNGAIKCRVEIIRDIETSQKWKEMELAMDPYESSLAGQGPRLAWFLGADGAVASINGSQGFIVDISVCTTCPVPTDIEESGILMPEQWSAPPSNAAYDKHDAAIVMPFERDSNEVITYEVQVHPGQTLVLWQGVLVE